MKTTRSLTCIGCPLGCQITVESEDGAVVCVIGNTCPRGEAYARKEVTAPARIVTTTVRVRGGELAAVSVKTEKEIPKEKIFDCIRALKVVETAAPVRTGQVILADAAGTGVNVIATKDVDPVA
jgi:CxxC motif-containing protein